MSDTNIEVAILMGSKSDLPVVSQAKAVLDEYGVSSDMQVLSAHRTPDALRAYLARAEARGVQVFIACAGMAAHLAGVIASSTVCPVLGVPLVSGSLQGLDALLSTVQMPSGMPVGTLALGEAGAKNAAILAVQILALHNPDYKTRLVEARRQKAAILEAECVG